MEVRQVAGGTGGENSEQGQIRNSSMGHGEETEKPAEKSDSKEQYPHQVRL